MLAKATDGCKKPNSFFLLLQQTIISMQSRDGWMGGWINEGRKGKMGNERQKSAKNANAMKISYVFSILPPYLLALMPDVHDDDDAASPRTLQIACKTKN